MFNFACPSQKQHVSQWKITCLVIGFFNPVIPFLFLASHLTDILSIPNLPRFCFIIPNPEPQIREIPDPEKPIGDPSINGLEDVWAGCNAGYISILSIPNLAPILLYNPESRASNKGNPGSRETYWGHSCINGLDNGWVGCNSG